MGQHNRGESADLVQRRMHGAALSCACGDRSAIRRCAAELAALPTDEVDRAAERLLESTISGAWEQGWLPADLMQLTRREQRSPRVAAVLLDAVAAQCRQYPATSLHPRWQAQLGDLGAQVWWQPGQPHLQQWAHRNGCDRQAALSTMLELLAVLCLLIPLPHIVPAPGVAAGSATVPSGQLDDKMLARVRGLLAKAESTTFPEEAEALSAKAQELMSRHAIQRAVLDARRPDSAPPTARRLWLDRPYVGAKSTLVTAVARTNRCRTVLYEQLGLVTVLGVEVDLDIVELLTTSLLLQATKAMLGSKAEAQSRTRSYRRAFLLAYAARIRERLAAATATATADVGGDLLPVLAGREAVVDDLVRSLFPGATRRTYSVDNRAGWSAGRAAADVASLQGRRAVGGG